MISEPPPAMALDFGTYNVRTGWAGDDAPISVSRNSLDGSCPLTPAGEVTSWDAVERVWKHEMMKSHATVPTCVMVNVPALATASDREGYVRLIMESFDADGAYVVAIPGVSALYSSGRTTGVVLDIGEYVSTVTPIYEGHYRYGASRHAHFGGRNLTDAMAEMLRGHTDDRAVATHVKETHCGFGAEAVDYKLPDGTVIALGEDQLRRYPQLLFSTMRVHELVASCIKACDIDTRLELKTNIIMSGFTSLLRNAGVRLSQELGAHFRGKVRSFQPPECGYSVWIGMSILASLTVFQERWINKQEYDDEGPGVVRRKCF